MDVMVLCSDSGAPGLDISHITNVAGQLIDRVEEADGEGSAGSASNEASWTCHGWEGPSSWELTVRFILDMIILVDFCVHFVLGFSYYDRSADVLSISGRPRRSVCTLMFACLLPPTDAKLH
jgi:hypothetical protein